MMKRIHNADLDLNLLKVFDALFDTHSASRAAANLGVSQSAVSHALARLRTLFRDPLFVRTAGRMEPTPRAQRLAEPVREALVAAARALAAEETFDPRRDPRIFSIGASDSLQTVLFSRALSGLAEEGMRPVLRLRSLDRDAALVALDEGEIDLAVGYLPQIRRWHDREVLYEEGHVCLFNPRLLSLPVPLSLEAYIAHGHIMPSLRGEVTSFVDEALDALGRQRRVVATTTEFLAIPMILHQAPLIATLPKRLAQYCANAASLATSPLPFASPKFQVSMVWHRRDSGSPSCAWLRHCIAAANDALLQPRKRVVAVK